MNDFFRTQVAWVHKMFTDSVRLDLVCSVAGVISKLTDKMPKGGSGGRGCSGGSCSYKSSSSTFKQPEDKRVVRTGGGYGLFREDERNSRRPGYTEVVKPAPFDPCQLLEVGLMECVNTNDLSQCQGVMDALTQCQESHARTLTPSTDKCRPWEIGLMECINKNGLYQCQDIMDAFAQCQGRQ